MLYKSKKLSKDVTINKVDVSSGKPGSKIVPKNTSDRYVALYDRHARFHKDSKFKMTTDIGISCNIFTYSQIHSCEAGVSVDK